MKDFDVTAFSWQLNYPRKLKKVNCKLIQSRDATEVNSLHKFYNFDYFQYHLLPAYWNYWAKALCPMLGRGLYKISEMHSYWLLKCIILTYVCLESAFVHYEEGCTLHIPHGSQFKLYLFKTNNKEKKIYNCWPKFLWLSWKFLLSWGYSGGKADTGSVSATDCFYTASLSSSNRCLLCK